MLSLPMPVDQLIPHRPPMQLISTLLEVRDGVGVVEAVVDEDGLLVDGDGRLAGVALIEMAAQAVAAFCGYEDRLAGNPVGAGYLVAVTDSSLTGHAAVGDRLRIEVERTAALGGFAVADGRVRRGDRQLASCSIRVFVPGREEPSP